MEVRKTHRFHTHVGLQSVHRDGRARTDKESCYAESLRAMEGAIEIVFSLRPSG